MCVERVGVWGRAEASRAALRALGLNVCGVGVDGGGAGLWQAALRFVLSAAAGLGSVVLPRSRERACSCAGPQRRHRRLGPAANVPPLACSPACLPARPPMAPPPLPPRRCAAVCRPRLMRRRRRPSAQSWRRRGEGAGWAAAVVAGMAAPLPAPPAAWLALACCAAAGSGPPQAAPAPPPTRRPAAAAAYP